MIFDDLAILGSGTIVPLPDRACSGYLLRGSGREILIDCGPGTLLRLAELEVSAASLRTLLVSHFHLDHVSELAPLLNSRWLQGRGSPQEIEIIGPAGTREHLSWLAGRMDSWFADCPITVREHASEPFEAAGMRIRTALTGHTPESICFRLEDELGRVLFYSGDTDYNEALLPLAQEADIALIECSMPDTAKLEGHLTPRLAARLAERAGVRRLVLTHFYREVTEGDALAQARSHFGGPILLARDRMRIPFGAADRPTPRPRAES